MSDEPRAASYPAPTIAKLLDITERQVFSLAAGGILPRVEPGRFEIVPVVRAYIKYFRGRTVEGDAKSGEFIGSRTRLLNARAQKAEAEVAILAGTLLQRDEVESAWSAVVMNIRARLLAIPSSIAPALSRAKGVRENAAIVKGAIDVALTEIAATVVYAAPAIDEGVAGAAFDADVGAAAGATAAEPDAIAMG